MLQCPCFKRCFEPTGMFVAVAPDHLVRRLQLNLTSIHVCYSCIYQQICLNQLQLIFKHIRSCVAEPVGKYMLHLRRPAVMSLCSYPTNGLKHYGHIGLRSLTDGHFGRHLEYFKTLNDTRVASVGFIKYNS